MAIGFFTFDLFNRRLFDKLEQHERQMEEMKAGEMEELLTPDEKEKIATVKRNITRYKYCPPILSIYTLSLDWSMQNSNWTRPSRISQITFHSIPHKPTTELIKSS